MYKIVSLFITFLFLILIIFIMSLINNGSSAYIMHAFFLCAIELFLGVLVSGVVIPTKSLFNPYGILLIVVSIIYFFVEILLTAITFMENVSFMAYIATNLIVSVFFISVAALCLLANFHSNVEKEK